jgi:bifunctional non-homologous end joining protein LigD
MMGVITIGGRQISVGNLDKVWFARSKITKGAILEYYHAVAPYMLPHCKDHLITMQRFPEGIKGESFYQKNAAAYFPRWIKTVPIEKKEGGTVNYIVCNNAATLVYLANQGALTFHAWLSRYTKLHYPDRMIFDLDPSKDDFAGVIQAAQQLKAIFDELKIPAFVMTTGSRGMHVYVPLKRVHTFEYVADFSYRIAQKLLAQSPKAFTLEVRKNKRRGKIFIDTLRNRYSATSVIPYAVRPHENAPVAAPLHWSELRSATLTSQKFTIKNIQAHLKADGDPWKDVDAHALSLKKYEAVLESL